MLYSNEWGEIKYIVYLKNVDGMKIVANAVYLWHSLYPYVSCCFHARFAETTQLWEKNILTISDKITIEAG